MTIYFRYIAVLLFILGIYVGAPLKIGNVPIPAFLAGVSGLFLLAANASQVQKRHVWMLMGLGLLALPGIVFNLGDGAEVARLKGGGQLVYSVVIAYGLFLELRGWGRERVAKLFGVVALLIVAGCFLEIYTDFRLWSDSFRSAVFEQGTLYKSEFREQYGEIRPKLFTVEPSYVAIFFLLSVTMWFTLAKPALGRSRQYFLLTIAGMFLIASPIVLLSAFIPVLNFLFLKEKSWNLYRTVAEAGAARKLFVVLLYSSALLLAMLAIWRGAGIIHTVTEGKTIAAEGKTIAAEGKTIAAEGRLEQIVHGKDDSFTGRLVAPPLVAYHVLRSSPAFGVGLEAKERLNGVALQVFQRLGMQTAHVPFNTLGGAVTNNFWLHWIYLGLAGGLLMLFWQYKLMRQVGVHYPLYCFVVIAMFMQTMGGYVTPRFWFVSFLIMLLGTLQNSRRDSHETVEHASDAQK